MVDLLILVLLIYAVVHNWRNGFLRQFWSTFGFIAGLLLGRWLTNITLTLAHNSTDRSLIALITIFGFALLGLTLGEYVGIHLKYRWIHTKFNNIDNALGSIFTIASVLLSVWLVASVLSRVPSTSLKSDLSSSKIVTELDRLLPPAPTIISDLSRLIEPNGFPDVFIGNEPIPRGNVNLPSLGDFQTAVNGDKDSVVRIQGIGCGGIVSGSGFVVANNLVTTNAHVVAGISHPYVEDVNGRHGAQVVWFDPNLDLAVLSTSNLAGKPLVIDTSDQSSGTPGVVLGYPGGGSFNAVAAAVLDEFNASGRNIYGDGITLRSVYELQTTVIPGNSGGPLIEKNGEVMGVVFAESTSYPNVGYALAISNVNSEIKQAEKSSTSVSTGQCAQ